jgi:hypothetical protein
VPTLEELIAKIYEITVAMHHTLEEENDLELEKLLNDRNTLMNKVDIIRAENPGQQYSPLEKKMLEDTQRLDQSLMLLIKENQTKSLAILNQLKKKKQVSKEYYPHSRQTNGVFIDAKK